ncbi:MAG TPA: F0F1 ATP synthase subunit delta [Candidatus Sulfotelmatobacter sp.]|nr:F0F1 ATP synthase subunit delta [Candidatus Sulfotelmatobacter sp.]
MSSEANGAIADRYSAALFELAEQQSALDAVAADLKTLKAMVAESPDLRRLLRSPVVSRRDQQKAVGVLAVKAGFNGLTQKFLGLVAQNRRLFALDGVIEAYLNRLAAKRGEVTATVSSAVALNETQVGAISAALKKVVGSNVTLDLSVDPALLGGLVVKVGSRMVDGSLRTKLQHLQLAMKGVG